MNTALTLAASNGHTATVALLLADSRVDVNLYDTVRTDLTYFT